jgi:spoIIIJ-associated protein
MIKEAIGTGPTIEAALEAARLALGAPEEADVVTEILEQPSKKLFKGTPAKARAYYEESEFAKAEAYIKNILRLMGVESRVLTVEEDDGVRFSLDCGSNDGYVIGRRGETLDALQYLVRLVVSRGREDYRRVSVNVGDYREQREQTLRDLAISSASKAKKFGRNITLPPMTPFDRRIVHTEVQGIEGVSSFSVGEGSDRRVIVAPDEQYRRSQDRRGYNDNRRPGGNMQRNQRNAQNRRFPGDDRQQGGQGGYRRGDERQGQGGYRRDDGYKRDDRPRDGYRRDDRPRDSQGGRDSRGANQNANQRPAQGAQPPRPPRGDNAASRYGKLEPRRAGSEKQEKNENQDKDG